METKKFWKSKLFWASVLTFGAGVATSLSGSLEAGVPLTLVGVLNAILRVYTKHPIVFRD